MPLFFWLRASTHTTFFRTRHFILWFSIYIFYIHILYIIVLSAVDKAAYFDVDVDPLHMHPSLQGDKEIA